MSGHEEFGRGIQSGSHDRRFSLAMGVLSGFYGAVGTGIARGSPEHDDHYEPTILQGTTITIHLPGTAAFLWTERREVQRLALPSGRSVTPLLPAVVATSITGRAENEPGIRKRTSDSSRVY